MSRVTLTDANAATLRVQRYSTQDGSGAGLEGGPSRLTHPHLAALTEELAGFEGEMTARLSPGFVPLTCYLVTEGGRLLLVGRFVDADPA